MLAHLLKVQINVASGGGAVGGHSQYRLGGVPCYLGRGPARLRGLNTVIKVHRHVPATLLCGAEDEDDKDHER